MNKDLGWGLGYGLFFAVAYSAVAGFILNSSGEELPSSMAFLVIGGYFASGIVSGVLLGVLRSKLTSKKRAMLLGIVIAYPATLIMTIVADERLIPITRSDLIVAAIMAVVFGGFGGWHFGPDEVTTGS